jgi:hypothetical protein
MPTWMVAGSICIGSPRSSTACRSGSAPPCPWPRGGSEIAALAYAVELRSWIVQPDPGQQDLLDSALTHLRQAEVGHSALIGAALGLRDWIRQDGSRAAIRAALPLYLRERVTRQPLTPLTGSDALKPGEFDDAEGFTVRFLEAVTWEAEDARGLLWTMEREWRAARTVVSRRLGSRSTSRLPQAVDVLAASPLLSVSGWLHLSEQNFQRISGASAGFKPPRSAEAG